MKTVLITGATGLIGQEIVKSCHARNWKVHYLTTSKKKLSQTKNYKGFYWNPMSREIDANCFSGVDTIINLVGASISKRWTQDYKKEIINSRTESATLLFDTIKINNFAVKHLVSASAIGIYPSSQTNYYDESFHKPSDSFLGTVVEKWEDAVDQFSKIGIKVSKIRIGLVLSGKGGALTEIAKPIRYGFGSAFGNGQQWQSWIHINDLAEQFVFIVKNGLVGVYNGVSPNPVSNSELIKTVSRVLKKPLIMPKIPKVFMKLVLGEMHLLLFESQRVSSQKIESAGFSFKYHHLEPAIRQIFK